MLSSNGPLLAPTPPHRNAETTKNAAHQGQGRGQRGWMGRRIAVIVASGCIENEIGELSNTFLVVVTLVVISPFLVFLTFSLDGSTFNPVTFGAANDGPSAFS